MHSVFGFGWINVVGQWDYLPSISGVRHTCVCVRWCAAERDSQSQSLPTSAARGRL